MDKNGRSTTNTGGRDTGIYSILPSFWDSSYISEIDLREYSGEYKSFLGERFKHGRCCDTEWSSCQSSTSGHVEDNILLLRYRDG